MTDKDCLRQESYALKGKKLIIITNSDKINLGRKDVIGIQF